MIARRLLPSLTAVAVMLALLAVLSFSDSAPARAFAHVDFYDYYYAGAAALRGRDPYDAAAAMEAAQAAGVAVITGSSFIYPPWVALAFAPLALASERRAAACFYVLSATAILAALARLARIAPGASGRIWIFGALFPPTLFTLWVGQINGLLLALLVAAWCLRDERPRLAGTAIGIAAAVKLAPALLLVPCLGWRRRRLVTAAIGVVGGLFALGEIALPGATARYVNVALRGAIGGVDRLAHPVNQGLWAGSARAFLPNPWTRPLLVSPTLAWLVPTAIALLLLAWTGRRSARRASESALWAATSALQLLASPLAWESTFLLLLLGMVLLLHRRGPIGFAYLLLVGQRALDAFANAPERHPIIASFWPLSSLGLLAALCVLWAARGEAAAPRDPVAPRA